MSEVRLPSPPTNNVRSDLVIPVVSSDTPRPATFLTDSVMVYSVKGSRLFRVVSVVD